MKGADRRQEKSSERQKEVRGQSQKAYLPNFYYVHVRIVF